MTSDGRIVPVLGSLQCNRVQNPYAGSTGDDVMDGALSMTHEFRRSHSVSPWRKDRDYVKRVFCGGTIPFVSGCVLKRVHTDVLCEQIQPSGIFDFEDMACTAEILQARQPGGIDDHTAGCNGLNNGRANYFFFRSVRGYIQVASLCWREKPESWGMEVSHSTFFIRAGDRVIMPGDAHLKLATNLSKAA